MGRPFDFEFCSAEGSSHGEMHCGHCNKPITEGEYRAYKRTKNHDWGFVTHHRACCADDAGWLKKDAREKKHETTVASIEAEVAALFARFPPQYASVIAETVSDREGVS